MRLSRLVGLGDCWLFVAVLSAATASQGAEWPAWLGNQNRSGSSEEKLPDEMDLAWVWRARHAPSPALAPPRNTARRGGFA